MRACLYARCSTADKGQDTENQLQPMRALVAAKGWTLDPAYEFVDYETGAKAERKQFQAMLLAAHQRKFDVLVFWSLDRLTREGALPTLQYLNQLTGDGVAFLSFTEQYLDSCGVFKDAVVSILAVIAKQERLRLSERVKAGIARHRASGKGWARERTDVDRGEVVRLRAEGLSHRKIAAALGVSNGLVYDVLKGAAA